VGRSLGSCWFETKGTHHLSQTRLLIRDASPADDEVMDAIARQGDASANGPYVALLRSQSARLLVAESAGNVVGFGGVVEIGGTSMLTDLFVAADARGAGIGTRLLHDLFDGSSRRMTFSSSHPAALAAYQRMGMDPQWRLLYFEGIAIGDGVPLPNGEWQHDRVSLVNEMARQGAHVTADVVVATKATKSSIARLQSARPVEVAAAAIASLAPGSTVTMCTPEHSPVADWAQEHGFNVVDYDSFCATPGVSLPVDLHCLDPGLA
jgi:GNAT superfamily N-acetyltransferase